MRSISLILSTQQAKEQRKLSVAAARKRYEQSPKGKAKRKAYARSAAARVRYSRYGKSDKGKARNKRYEQSGKGKARTLKSNKTEHRREYVNLWNRRRYRGLPTSQKDIKEYLEKGYI